MYRIALLLVLSTAGVPVGEPAFKPAFARKFAAGVAAAAAEEALRATIRGGTLTVIDDSGRLVYVDRLDRGFGARLEHPDGRDAFGPLPDLAPRRAPHRWRSMAR